MTSQKYMQQAIDSSQEDSGRGEGFTTNHEWEDPAMVEIAKAVEASSGSSPV